MRAFIIIRVPITLSSTKEPERRDNYGPRPDVVATTDDAEEAKRLVVSFSFGDYRHHYYALELRFSGAPDRKSAIAAPGGKPAKGTRPKLAVNNITKGKEKAS